MHLATVHLFRSIPLQGLTQPGNDKRNAAKNEIKFA